MINIGLDAGSTTVKVVAVDEKGSIVFKEYKRHFADIAGTVMSLFEQLKEKLGDVHAHLSITGSAGMGIAERAKIPFVQEVVASCELILKEFPSIRTLVDIGGEDAKMIFFREGKSPDIRMNGNCAGGTGSFIDQMATILNVEVSELSSLANHAKTIYPIASRCGVFSKTDVQNLLARNVSKEDIAASIFHAVSMQVITSLARGYKIEPKVFLCGGPFTFIPALREAFIKQSEVNEGEFVVSQYAEVVPAWGAAINASEQVETKLISEYSRTIEDANKKKFIYVNSRLKPLFCDKEERKAWNEEKQKYSIPSIDIKDLHDNGCFIGIDSGSTTTKIIATDSEGRVFFRFYDKNKGNSLETATYGLSQLYQHTNEAGKELRVLGSCVTGYGEDLIKKAFSLDSGMVETIAHYTAAYHFNPQVSFILDIGGQDMKATFIENGTINRLEINEACSSGCGSFIETFARSLNHTPEEFSEIAFQSQNPCDLGTRCTVFMNSKVKQSLREGASVADISAGLGYSVIKNCLNKVLKLKDNSELGDHIMVQGGTFRNLAVIRSLENELGKSVMITDYPELMGAYGAALFAKESAEKGLNNAVSLSDVVRPQEYTGKISVCKGCENQCTVTRFRFENGNRYFSGNKCEKVFCNAGEQTVKGTNIYEEKYNLLFDRNNKNANPKASPYGGGLEGAVLRIGIPRALGVYEDYPFWHALFAACNVEIVLSDPSTMKLYEKGISTVMADNICFPAKLANGHIFNLIDKKVDRIFLPFVVHESKEDERTTNSYNCPIVTGYSEVIRSAINPERDYGIPFDSPTFSFKDKKLMKKACEEYLRSILPGMSKKEIDSAFEKGLQAQQEYEDTLNKRCKAILANAEKENRLVVLLTGRPYHSDPLIQHKIADIVADFGVDVITEDIVRDMESAPENVQSIMQWAYTNRILKSALWAGKAPENVHYIELTSFGCGPDAFIIDEVTDILKRNGKNATFLKIDDINNIGSTRLRIRSLIESLKFKHEEKVIKSAKAVHTKPFLDEDRKRKILMPWFADFYSPFLPAAFSLLGYEAENLPPSDMQSAEYGLKYSNNEICYPATLVVGDFMKALDSGKYKREEVALGITQTGGQCRATNYVTLLKKAMIATGFEDIPVITVSTSAGTINEQPGFKVKWTKVIRPVLACMAFADCLSQMYYATAPREVKKGIAKQLKDKYIQLGIKALENADAKEFYTLAEKAAHEFARANNGRKIPRIGIVGEIYVKYNNFGHGNIVNWLIEQGVEPVVPALTDFFTTFFASRVAKEKGNIANFSFITKPIINFAERFVFNAIHKMEDKAAAFPYINRVENPHDAAANASEIINLNAQFGEGWRIAGEFAHFVHIGVNNVVSLQPFGCIANQVISKGIEKRAKERYPSLNLLFLDFDSNMAEANVFNRLHFMIRNAQEEIKQQELKTKTA
ncbi:2-hydroxyglutaryl-CoA dehydratase [Paludibacter sp. 221]|uniref:acyl-CoA dehydratase activase-related protein n=1 Tax=Paludibacter sp. 221 TaxID=2302939 RepID=UPI0013D5197F|nr:acyl-CoA dehydratase activase-related protein [Paludibacter sp. 221]NDV47552.1 2-hydroxyglutaryl-CoA dehydratase [Paludibacter sp. 221]